MYPKLLEIPLIHLPIYAYGFMVMMGFLTGIFISSRRAQRDNLSPEIVFDIGLIAMISGIIGARIFYIMYFPEQFDFSMFNIADGGISIVGFIIGFFLPFTVRFFRSRKQAPDQNQKAGPAKPASAGPVPMTFSTFIKLFVLSIVTAIVLGRVVHLLMNRGQYKWDIFFVWQGGLVFYGGVVLSIICIITYLKMNKLIVLKVGDLLMPSIIFGVAFGRIGCFLNGCCYGKISNVPWAVCFPVFRDERGDITGSPAFTDQLRQHLLKEDSVFSLPVHPTELYESLMCILFFVILSILWDRKKRFDADGKPFEAIHGYIVVWAGILYAIERFIDESLRGDNKSFISGLSYSQLVSIGIFAVCLGLLAWIKISNKSKVVKPT